MALTRIDTPIADVCILQPQIFGDARGRFLELFNKQAFEQVGLGHLNFVQDNLSTSQKGTIRGLHFQLPPHTQGKLVCALQGSVLDVVVDLRQNSPTYGKHFAVELSEENCQMLWVPEGFAHGFQVLSETCMFFYKCTNFYMPSADRGLAYNDPALAIPWREIPPILSEKDQKHPNLKDLERIF